MYLYEAAEIYRDKDLDYIPEYLATKSELTLTEAKELLFLAEADAEKVVKKINKEYEKRFVELEKNYKKLQSNAKATLSGKELKSRLSSLEKKYKLKVKNLKDAQKFAKKHALDKFSTLKSSIYRTWKTMGKKGKVGVGVAAAGTLGLAGYGGYKAYQQHKLK